MTTEEVQDAASTAIQLIENASARISRLCREQLISSVNKALLPLAKDDEGFTEAPPLLFGPNFAKRSKEFLDQVKAIRTTIPTKGKEPSKKPFFRGPPPSKRGEAYRFQGGDSNSSSRGRSRQGQSNSK